MLAPSAPCRDCDRSSYQCNGCQRTFCEHHFTDHRQALTDRLNNITSEYSNIREILALPPSYESLAEDTELINKINRWETETIDQVKEIAAGLREKINRRSDTIATEKFVPVVQQLTEELQTIRQSNNFIESDIERLTTKLNNLKLQVEDCRVHSIELRLVAIDWTKYIQMVAKQNASQLHQRSEIHLERLLTTEPRVTLDSRNAEWYVLGNTSSSNSSFLHYQHTKKHKRLSIVNINGHEKQIPWYEDQSIWDSCWSTFLNKFLILADNRLYTYDDSIVTSDSLKLVEEVRTRQDKMEYLRCLCIDATLFITYDERNSSVDEYNMSNWAVVHKHENIVKQNEIIISIASSGTNSNLIGLTVLDDKQNWHFELRDRQLKMVSLIKLDKSEFNRRVISLPNSSSSWLIVHTGLDCFTVLNENAQTKKVVKCAENIDLATYFPDRNCLVVLTQKSKLKFFDL